MYRTTYGTDFRRKSIGRANQKTTKPTPITFKSSSMLRDMMKNFERPRSSYQTEFHKRPGTKGLSKPVEPVKSVGIPLGTRQKDFMRRHKTVDRSTYRRVPPRPSTALGIRREVFPEVLNSEDCSTAKKSPTTCYDYGEGHVQVFGENEPRQVSEQSSRKGRKGLLDWAHIAAHAEQSNR